jgi:hypothetical protein
VEGGWIMEDKLLNSKNTSCLNDLHFKEKHKNNVLLTIKDGSSFPKRNSWYKKGLSIAVLASLLIIVIGFATTKSGIFQSASNHVAVEKLQELEELKDIPYPFKLPTYIPFSVENVHFSKTYIGPRDYREKEQELKKDDLNYYRLNITYANPESEELYKMLEVSVMNATSMNQLRDEHEEVMINGINGSYMFNGAVQLIHWEEDDVLYDITLYVRDKENLKQHETPPISKEEMIKIAESFERYRP